MRRAVFILPVALAAVVAAGCGGPSLTTQERYERGLVVCLSGAGGLLGEVDRIREGLRQGAVDRAVESFAWSRGGVLTDQTGIERNRQKAAELARRIEAYRAEYPGRPVHLIGVSAGTGLVVWALEGLREGHQVDGAVLIASSLGSRYDLSVALRNIRGRLYSFFSSVDPVLSVGVTLTGTVDRSRTGSGGLLSFKPPKGDDAGTERLYQEKLVQYGWKPADVVLGHLGGHLGATQSRFVSKRIAPLVLGGDAPPSPNVLEPSP